MGAAVLSCTHACNMRTQHDQHTIPGTGVDQGSATDYNLVHLWPLGKLCCPRCHPRADGAGAQLTPDAATAEEMLTTVRETTDVRGERVCPECAGTCGACGGVGSGGRRQGVDDSELGAGVPCMCTQIQWAEGHLAAALGEVALGPRGFARAASPAAELCGPASTEEVAERLRGIGWLVAHETKRAEA